MNSNKGNSYTYSINPTQWTINRSDGDPSYQTIISIVDEGAGEFITIEQESGELRMDPNEWPAVREVLDIAFEEVMKKIVVDDDE